MRTLKLCSCLFLSSAMLLLVACKSKEPPRTPQTFNVMINACAAPDVTVHEQDVVDWQAGDHDYTVRFKDPHEPTANPFPVEHGGSHHPHTIHGKSGCDPEGGGKFYCKYSLTRDNETS